MLNYSRKVLHKKHSIYYQRHEVSRHIRSSAKKMLNLKSDTFFDLENMENRMENKSLAFIFILVN